jgi:hypothetical protein
MPRGIPLKSMSPEARAALIEEQKARQRDHERKYRARRTPEQMAEFRAYQREYSRRRTDDQRAARRAYLRTYMITRRARLREELSARPAPVL